MGRRRSLGSGVHRRTDATLDEVPKHRSLGRVEEDDHGCVATPWAKLDHKSIGPEDDWMERACVHLVTVDPPRRAVTAGAAFTASGRRGLRRQEHGGRRADRVEDRRPAVAPRRGRLVNSGEDDVLAITEHDHLNAVLTRLMLRGKREIRGILRLARQPVFRGTADRGERPGER